MNDLTPTGGQICFTALGARVDALQTVEVAQMVLTKGSDFAHTLQQRGTPEDIEMHRAWIAIRAEALLDRYWDRRPSLPVIEVTASDWMHHLQQFTPEEITRACRAYQASKDRNRKPGPGDIAMLAEFARPHWQDVARKDG